MEIQKSSTDYNSIFWEIFVEKGWANNKNEEYKFTNIQNFIKENFKNFSTPVPQQNIEFSKYFYPNKGHHLVFLNGKYEPQFSSILENENVFIDILSQNIFPPPIPSSDSNNLFVKSSQFEPNKILYINTTKNSKQLSTIFIYYFFSNINENETLINPQYYLQAASQSQINIVEKNVNLQKSNVFVNKISQIHLDTNAVVNITKTQVNDKNVFEVDNMSVNQQDESKFYINTFSFKGKLIRNNLHICQDGSQCDSQMFGLYFLNDDTHVANHTTIDHRKPNSTSNELYKGVVDDYAKGVFNGKIFVRNIAQQTNAFQANNNISLSENAVIHTKPQLEIWADDVKCSHGCTVGQLDEEVIFYIKARGLNHNQAKAIVLSAFIKETIENVPLDFLKEEINKIINQKLNINE